MAAFLPATCTCPTNAAPTFVSCLLLLVTSLCRFGAFRERGQYLWLCEAGCCACFIVAVRIMGWPRMGRSYLATITTDDTLYPPPLLNAPPGGNPYSVFLTVCYFCCCCSSLSWQG